MLSERQRKINPVIKGAVAEFFSTAFLDIFPLRRLSQLAINCFEFEEIEKLPLGGFPVQWISSEAKPSEYPVISADRLRRTVKSLANILKEAFKRLP